MELSMEPPWAGFVDPCVTMHLALEDVAWAPLVKFALELHNLPIGNTLKAPLKVEVMCLADWAFEGHA